MGGHDTTGSTPFESLQDSTTDSPILFYDGDCGLCHAAVKFALARDPEGGVRFAPLGGETWTQLSQTTPNPALGRASAIDTGGIDLDHPPDTVILLQSSTLWIRTRAVVRLLRRLQKPWPWVANLLALIPAPLADLGYRTVAALRHRLFRRPDDLCPLVPPPLRKRFLD